MKRHFYEIFKFFMFKIDPELAHNFSMTFVSRFPLFNILFLNFCDHFKLGDPACSDRFSLTSGALTWKFPVGLAAGLDKNAEGIEFFTSTLFGAVEVGTVTPLPQSGNPKPRLFRYPAQRSIRNCMGFNNGGMDKMYQNVTSSPRNGKLLGVNLGKNKVTSEENASSDYKALYKKFCLVADYLVINVSSPNTPGLRDLQRGDGVEKILKSIDELRSESPCPLFVKISPDLDQDSILAVLKTAADYKLTGIIATNTTIVESMGAGGVSGAILKEKGAKVRNFVLNAIKDKQYDLTLIGVGGISQYEDIVDFWKHGGSFVQVYSSFIYEGPQLLVDLKNKMEEDMCRLKLNSVEELVNYYHNI
jgi:dihydroorotate dehydrogenase